ncbi:hypothetical protein ACXET9_02395 [Brachybacterium sp. DNPG3]
MHFLRRLNTAMERLADRMQGQDVERYGTAHERRSGADYAALMRTRQSQGSTVIGLGR